MSTSLNRIGGSSALITAAAAATTSFGVWWWWVHSRRMGFSVRPPENAGYFGRVQRTVVLTGATGGIGVPLVRALLRNHSRVIMAVRDVVKARSVADAIRGELGCDCGEIVILFVDLGSMESVRELVRKIQMTESSIDWLINLAGHFGARSERMSLTDDGFEYHFQTELFILAVMKASRMLMRLLEPLFAVGGSIINVTSTLANRANRFDFNDLNFYSGTKFSPFEAYARSKLALNVITRYAGETMTGIRVNAIHPGVVVTDLHRSHCPNRLLFEAWKLIGRLIFNSPENVGEAIAGCVVGGDQCFGNLSGRLFSGNGRLEKWQDTLSNDSNEFAQKLCEFSERVCDIKLDSPE